MARVSVTEHWPAPSVTHELALSVPYVLTKSTVLPLTPPPTTSYVTVTLSVDTSAGGSTWLGLGESVTSSGPRKVTVALSLLLPVASVTVAVTWAKPGDELDSVTGVAQWVVTLIVQVVELSDPKSVAKVTTAPSAAVPSLWSVTVTLSVVLVEPESSTGFGLGASVTLTAAPAAYGLKCGSAALTVWPPTSTVDESGIGP